MANPYDITSMYGGYPNMYGGGMGMAMGGMMGGAAGASPYLAAAQIALMLGKAGYQAYQAKKLSKEKRPDLEIPKSAIEAKNLAAYQASLQQAPGSAAAQRRLQDVWADTAYKTLEYSDNPSKAIFQTGIMGERIGDQYANIYAQDQASQQAAQRQYLNQLGLMSNQEYRQWKTNEMDPYMSSKLAEGALREASWRNVMGGMGNANLINWGGFTPTEKNISAGEMYPSKRDPDEMADYIGQ
jgi:hypothetical protein